MKNAKMIIDKDFMEHPLSTLFFTDFLCYIRCRKIYLFSAHIQEKLKLTK